MSKRFSQIEEGQKFQFTDTSSPLTLTKVGKNLAKTEDGTFRSFIHGNRRVTLLEDEKLWHELDFHTTEFSVRQLAGVVDAIIKRAVDTYGADRIKVDRLRMGILAAHRAKPIRLIALLNACAVDFPADVLYGIYRHYDPATDSIKGGWTAQHAEPHTPSIWDLLFG